MGEPEYGRLRHPKQIDPNKPRDQQVKEWYFNDPNIKYIMEHWNISPEHPGMEYVQTKLICRADTSKVLFFVCRMLDF